MMGPPLVVCSHVGLHLHANIRRIAYSFRRVSRRNNFLWLVKWNKRGQLTGSNDHWCPLGLSNRMQQTLP